MIRNILGKLWDLRGDLQEPDRFWSFRNSNWDSVPSGFFFLFTPSLMFTYFCLDSFFHLTDGLFPLAEKHICQQSWANIIPVIFPRRGYIFSASFWIFPGKTLSDLSHLRIPGPIILVKRIVYSDWSCLCCMSTFRPGNGILWLAASQNHMGYIVGGWCLVPEEGEDVIERREKRCFRGPQKIDQK